MNHQSVSLPGSLVFRMLGVAFYSDPDLYDEIQAVVKPNRDHAGPFGLPPTSKRQQIAQIMSDRPWLKVKLIAREVGLCPGSVSHYADVFRDSFDGFEREAVKKWDYSGLLRGRRQCL